jgi:hypothetical protein
VSIHEGTDYGLNTKVKVGVEPWGKFWQAWWLKALEGLARKDARETWRLDTLQTKVGLEACTTK